MPIEQPEVRRISNIKIDDEPLDNPGFRLSRSSFGTQIKPTEVRSQSNQNIGQGQFRILSPIYEVERTAIETQIIVPSYVNVAEAVQQQVQPRVVEQQEITVRDVRSLRVAQDQIQEIKVPPKQVQSSSVRVVQYF